jgi:hypothetical protein
MPARKMRVELFDTEGNRYTISFEGQVTRDKALRLLELLGGMPAGDANVGVHTTRTLSKFDKVQRIIQKNFPIVWFSSREVQTVYETELKEPIGLSTVSTYLLRMTRRGIVLKMGASGKLKYKVALNTPQIAVNS